MLRYLLIAIVIPVLTLKGQDVSGRLKEATFNWQYEAPPAKRNLIKFKKKSSKYNPLMYAGAAALFLYQRVFSEQIQAECVYEVSCSEYTKRSIENKGVIRGVLAGFNQLTECFNGAVFEHPGIFIHNSRIVNVSPEDGN